MNNFFKIGVFLLVGSALIVSCSKTTDEYINNDDSHSVVQRSAIAGNYHLHLDGDETNCSSPGNTCLWSDDDVIITPDYNVFIDLFSEIGKGDSDVIAQKFNANFDVLIRYINPYYVNGVKSGRMSVTARENQKDNLKFLLFEDRSNGEKMAYQLKFVR